MEKILGDQRFQSLLLYLDGVVVFSSSFENLSCLRLVLSCFQECGLKVKWSKCSVFLKSGPGFWLEGIQLRPETNNKLNVLPIRLCFINVYTYPLQ